MTKRALVAVVALGLGGCATVHQPHELVTNMRPEHPKYATEECRQARAMALSYDDNTAGRAGLGLGLGLLLGPFGLPIAIAVDSNQAGKRQAVVAELARACMTPEEAAKLKPAEPPGGRPKGPGRSIETSEPGMR